MEDITPAIIMREGNGWRQYLVVSNERVAIVHMKPASLRGWNIERVAHQGAEDWPKMSRDQIVDWKRANDDGFTVWNPAVAPTFRDRLFSVA